MSGLNGLGGLFRALEISGSGMRAERRRLEVVASNIANAHTSRTESGEPYRRQLVVFEVEKPADPFARRHDDTAQGVRVQDVVQDPSEFPQLYRPGHPDADETGHIRMPNVNITHEMVDLLAAMRSYEANLKASRTSMQMAQAALELGRR
ncbi:MAG: flagellar basal body rod protein FlgC [Planctomycetes bacterium]|nr:flagellar basal body rod protein FlgC [Planctomycetota bacterium]